MGWIYAGRMGFFTRYTGTAPWHLRRLSERACLCGHRIPAIHTKLAIGWRREAEVCAPCAARIEERH